MRKQVCEVKRMWVDSRETVENPSVGEEWGLENGCDRMGSSEDIFMAGEQGMWGKRHRWSTLSFEEVPGVV